MVVVEASYPMGEKTMPLMVGPNVMVGGSQDPSMVIWFRRVVEQPRMSNGRSMVVVEERLKTRERNDPNR